MDATEPPSICAIGDLILDVIVLPGAPLRADADTPSSIRFCAGGQAANVAAWAAALGAKSRLICARGSDVASELAAAELERLHCLMRVEKDAARLSQLAKRAIELRKAA